ncbi:MAG: altronate dehydratase family protein [Succinivibrio sp.]|jgi:altronate hydrolase|nr:altronate dehydratase family protein [Succinivibrio sp.]
MQAIVINPRDCVAVALEDLKAGTEVKLPQGAVILQEDITRGHKFALRDLKAGEGVIKYGFPIGYAKQDIKKGFHVHTQNVRTGLSGKREYRYDKVPAAKLPSSDLTFEGYERADGVVGIRNELWILPTVFCVNRVSQALADYAKSRLGAFPHVEDALALTHPFGCSQMGEDQETTRRLLGALSRHQNAGAVLVVGLGCENSNIGVMKDYLDASDPRIRFLNCQDVEDELEAGKALVDELLAYADKARRSTQPLSKLRIGLKCGGSDGLSGITANPLIGRVSDLVAGSGGTSVMTEVPEMFGAEQLLMNRARDEGIFQKTVELINNFKGYFESHGETVSENPSPGNKAGGITTLEDKSLGCVQKGGTAEVSGVLRYTERLKTPGLNLLQAPGNDGVSCTALAAAGVDLILFSTGRGTPFATVVPTLKISTNSALWEKKGGKWIDFNAGVLAEGADPQEQAQLLLKKICAVASGERSVSEERGFHEVVIWKDGVTL